MEVGVATNHIVERLKEQLALLERELRVDLPERIREMGGEAVISRVGYTFLYDRMVAAGAVFGAETSGHVYFRVSDTYYTESAAYALAVMLRLLAARGRPLSELVEPLRGRTSSHPRST
jgi:phosphomannomutase